MDLIWEVVSLNYWEMGSGMGVNEERLCLGNLVGTVVNLGLKPGVLNGSRFFD